MSIQDNVQAIYERLASAAAFHPGSAELLDDVSLQAGDLVTMVQGGTEYQMPVYSQTIHWNGAATTTVNSTGNEKREPLPALARKQYGAASKQYRTTTKFETKFEQTDHYISLIATEDQFGQLGTTPTTTAYAKISLNSRNIEAEVTRATQAEGQLSTRVTLTETGLASKVSQTDYNGNTIASLINQSATTIRLQASKIDLDGAVTTGNITIGGAQARTLYFSEGLVKGSFNGAANVSYNPVTFSVGGTAMTTVLSQAPISIAYTDLPHYHTITATEGTGADAGKIILTLGAVSDTEQQTDFNIADTKAYRDMVSALTVTSLRISNTSYVEDATYNLTLQARNAAGTSLRTSTITFEATQAYQAGVDAGSNVTIPAQNIVSLNNENYDSQAKRIAVTVRATASNGATNTNAISVDASAAYAAGVQDAGGGAAAVTVDSIEKYQADSYSVSTGKYSVYLEATASNGNSRQQTLLVDGTDAFEAGETSVTIAASDIIAESTSYNSGDHSTTVTVRATASNTATETNTINVSGSQAFSAGKTSVTLADPVWTNHGQLTTSNTVTVSTVNRAPNLSKSVPLFLVLSGTTSRTVYLKSGSNAGTDQASLSIPQVELSLARVGTDTYNSSTHNTTVNVLATSTDGATATQTFEVDGTNAFNASTIPYANLVYDSSQDTYNPSTHYISINVTATATNGATRTRTFGIAAGEAYTQGVNSVVLSQLSVPNTSTAPITYDATAKTISFYPYYRLSGRSTGEYWTQLTINDPGLYDSGYNSGFTAGKQAVTLTDYSWNPITGPTYPSSQTLKVSTVNRTPRIDKSISLYLVPSGTKVSMRVNSTSGTKIAETEVSPPLQSKIVDTNGTVTADSGYYGLDSVTVDVQPNLQDKTVTANGTVTADSGYDGLGTVTVNVPSSSPEIVFEAVGSQTARAGQTAVDGFTSGATQCFSAYTIKADGSYRMYYKFKITAGGSTKYYYFYASP